MLIWDIDNSFVPNFMGRVKVHLSEFELKTHVPCTIPKYFLHEKQQILTKVQYNNMKSPHPRALTHPFYLTPKIKHSHWPRNIFQTTHE